jgi:hypothetical protein
MRTLSKRLAVSLLLALSTVALSGIARAQERPGDKGETAEAKKLRGRSTAPQAGVMDSAVTLDAMLAKNDASAFSQSKGASIEGWVIQAEKEEDGDFHVVLAANKGETDTKKWVIVEVPPAWQKKSVTMSEHALRDMVGKKVRVTGWLYWEPDADQPDPRGTRWELHPVTAITEAK